MMRNDTSNSRQLPQDPNWRAINQSTLRTLTDMHAQELIDLHALKLRALQPMQSLHQVIKLIKTIDLQCSNLYNFRSFSSR